MIALVCIALIRCATPVYDSAEGSCYVETYEVSADSDAACESFRTYSYEQGEQ